MTQARRPQLQCYLETLRILNPQRTHLTSGHQQADPLIAGGEGRDHVNHW